SRPLYSVKNFCKTADRGKKNISKKKTKKLHCECCRRAFSSEAAYRQHMNSKKHLERARGHQEQQVERGITAMSIGTKGLAHVETVSHLTERAAITVPNAEEEAQERRDMEEHDAAVKEQEAYLA
ncbi:hypothetical protein KIPB_012987, partial [Kipferlia bialata]